MVLVAANQLSTTLRTSTAQKSLWYSIQQTSSIQKSALPWHKKNFNTFMVQELLHASTAQESFMVFNESNQLGTTLCTSMAQEALMVLDLANQLDTTFHTSTAQELLHTSLAQESFMVFVAANQHGNTLRASMVYELLWYSMQPTSSVQPFVLP